MITPPWVRLSDVHDRARFGGKATQLGEAARRRMPVPQGIALSVELTGQLADGTPEAEATLDRALAELSMPIAVRSSEANEDSATSSAAGHYETLLNVGLAGVRPAITTVHASARSASAVQYRRHFGLSEDVAMAVVLQQMVHAEIAGVLFTKNPLDGADELVIEASWGLGETIVQGLVTPDRYRLTRGGLLLSQQPGYKDLAIRPRRTGGICRSVVPPHLRRKLCLARRHFVALAGLVEELPPVPLDVEWAFCRGELYLLQHRPITAMAT